MRSLCLFAAVSLCAGFAKDGPYKVLKTAKAAEQLQRPDLHPQP